jgi:signal transduction histidine kinase
VHRKDIDLVAECREEIEGLRTAMPAARIELHAPATLRGQFDPGAVREALANVVVNAAKYGEEGGTIDVRLYEDAGHAVLKIGNSGDTIPRATLDLMFEPLRRGGVSGGELENASLGLGLFIVDQIVKAHGGTVVATSADGTTAFTMRLPRA